MARAPFVIFSRPDSSGRKKYSARFQDADGRIIKTVALETGSKTVAVRKAQALLVDGVVSSKDDPLLLDFLAEFWTMKSAYVRGRALRGVDISERYVNDSRDRAIRILGEALKGVRLSELTPAILERAILKASETYGPRQVNIALQGIKVAYGFHCRQHRLANALATVQKLAEHPKARGTLSASEVAAIIAMENESPRARAAVLLGALCGLRLGEVRGLQWADVDTEHGLIEIKHNVPTASGNTVRAPKCGSYRTVPAPRAVLEALALCKAMPDASPLFCIYNRASHDRPIETVSVTRSFHRILARLALGDKYAKATPEEKAAALEGYKARSVCFHSLRHTYVSLTRAAGVPDFAVQRLAGHKSAEMMENYSHAENVVDFAEARKRIDKALDEAGGITEAPDASLPPTAGQGGQS